MDEVQSALMQLNIFSSTIAPDVEKRRGKIASKKKRKKKQHKKRKPHPLYKIYKLLLRRVETFRFGLIFESFKSNLHAELQIQHKKSVKDLTEKQIKSLFEHYKDSTTKGLYK